MRRDTSFTEVVSSFIHYTYTFDNKYNTLFVDSFIHDIDDYVANSNSITNGSRLGMRVAHELGNISFAMRTSSRFLNSWEKENLCIFTSHADDDTFVYEIKAANAFV